jgi:RNA polymerase subunit RPABC4/transcription elongation factor Spt4/predicted  nucleic acid-binding Zn-ribbon protein
VNDVLTLYPHLKPEVSDKNTVDVTTLSSHSGKQVWWQCSKGHHWQASVDSRTKKQATGCPYCSSRKVSEDYNANLPDELKKLWHPTKNHSDPNEVTVGSNRRVWWQCEKGHEWQGIINKQKKTHTCPYCFGRKVLQGFNDVATTHPQLLPEWDRALNSLAPEEVKAGSEQRVWWRCNKGHTWQATVTNRARLKQGCPSCWSRKFVSKGEEAVVKFLQDDLNQKVDTTVMNLLFGQELDMYLPKHKIAIEFNGVYWHSEQAGKDPKAHYKKWQACKEQGIQLIQIWEDDWRDRPELVKRMLAHKLGASREEVVQARKTSVISLTQEQTDEFLLQNHIQGSVNGGLRYGLIYLDRIVAVMVLKTKTPGVLDLLRYATSVSVPGGFTKLLKHVIRNVEKVSAVETFSDHCVSDGKLYEANGFQNAGDIPPDYMYVVKGVRRHKFGYRLANFRNSSDLIYKDGLTERELADLNNLPRIWDAGKTKWRKTV